MGFRDRSLIMKMGGGLQNGMTGGGGGGGGKVLGMLKRGHKIC